MTSGSPAAPDAAPGTGTGAGTRTDPYDALLLLSFGGPEKPADVLPFLRIVTAGRGIPDERLASVAEHYHHFGGRSPINDQCRALLAAIRADLAEHEIDLPVYWGNRNWDPFLADTLRTMRADGVRRAAVFATSAYSSYSGCRQYREDLATATAVIEAEAAAELAAGVPGNPVPRFDKVRHYFNHPGFVEPVLDNTRAGLAALTALPALAALTPAERERAAIVFVTHSIPTTMDAGAGPTGHGYSGQHHALATEICARLAAETGAAIPFVLAYCSRSGSPAQPWLEPDVNDVLRELAADGVPGVVVVPFGFVSDHMEVIYDLDVEAADTAAELGLPFVRAASVGIDPRFVALARDLVVERAAAERARADVSPGPDQTTPPRPTETAWPTMHDVCPFDCCPNPRGPKPALCQTAPSRAAA
jgi:ferrochelatase